MNIPFNKPYITGNESDYIRQACESEKLSGDGQFVQKCQSWLEKKVSCCNALLTPSCTDALEMVAILIDIEPGDEVIMPSYTFPSTANAFVLRGGIPVFVDIRPDTLNIDEAKIEAAITSKTKAIVPVHYAGVGCEMNVIMDIADKYNLYVIEDAAQGITSSYKDKALGSIGHLAAYSFHDTKNIICGEGGALLINDPKFVERAEIIREKGTDRSKFFRGQVDKYTWVDVGSSYLPSELTAAFLWAQFEKAEEITKKRLDIWHQYHAGFEQCEQQGLVMRPTIPESCIHNAHMYFLLLNTAELCECFMEKMKDTGVAAISHYVPLHLALAGKKYGKAAGTLPITEDIAQRIVRLPIHLALDKDQVQFIIAEANKIILS
jgi:dTDP-4-amino-4,6-dideoxygalactose transaminase